MGDFAEDMALLAAAADKAGRPEPPQVDEIDEDSDTIVIFMNKGKAEPKADAPKEEDIKEPDNAEQD